MNGWRLALQSLRYHARSHFGVLIGAALATAIITGALTVGDSVRYSLRQMALARLGKIEVALTGSARFVRERLAEDMSQRLNAPVASAVLLRGTAGGYAADGASKDTRVGNVQVIGTDSRFWELGPGRSFPFTTSDGRDAVLLNDRLARSLQVAVGDEVLLRVPKPSLLSRDAPLSTIEDATVTLRLPVAAILTDADFGRFSVEANQIPPHNAFVSLRTLQQAIGMEGRVNTLLVGPRRDGKPLTPVDATSALWSHWDLADVGLELRTATATGQLELRTKSVFLDPPIGKAAEEAMPGAQGVLTYFVNSLRVGDRATHYSTVAALQGPLIPADMKDDETLVNQWFADDTGAHVGDMVTLQYWVVGPLRRLEERSSRFRIRGILPMRSPASDPALMPDIPGLSDKKNCREWEPGVPVDLNKIRDKDQAYWDTYRGTPKAFITLKAGQTIWNNRFGNLTSVRYPGGAENHDKVAVCLRQTMNPASLGMFFQPVRQRALAASADSLDFGQLFLGFSLFLIVSALLLTALLFAFGVEQRAEEVGTLLALGFQPRQVQGFLLREGALIAGIAGLLGVLLAFLYGRLVISGLSGVWSDAVAGADLRFYAAPITPAIGFLSGFIMALLSLWGITRHQAKSPARDLLAGSGPSAAPTVAQRKARFRVPPLIVSAVCLILAVVLGFAGGKLEGESAAGAFFGAGALLLISGLCACRALLARWESAQATEALNLTALGRRNSARRIGRSLAAISLLASGSFLVVAVGANRHDAGHGAERRSSGTGGFALYGESPLPVYTDLNATAGRDEYNLDPGILTDTSIVALRVQEGDDASCLNLNRAQRPRLFGIPTAALAERKAFTFSESEPASGNSPWLLLDTRREDGAIPVVGDMNTVVWSLGKKLGDTLDYTDDSGQVRKLRIVGVLANSVLQGALLMSEDNFIRLFPSQAGYRVFLVDTPPHSDTVRTELTRGLEDVGLSLTPTAERLADFNTVENTYLSIFAALGGLGLLLGTVGLGVIVLRNALERRGELALLRAVGFTGNKLRELLFLEHGLLLALGLGVGILSALVAVLPALQSPGAEVPYVSLALTLVAIAASGFLSTWLAAAAALRAPLLSALRNE